MSVIAPGFIVAHSHRLQDLTDLVVSISRQYPLPPLASETILVQSNGIAQWLKQHLAAGLGVAALLDVTLPARFQWQAYRAVLGDNLPRHSPFDKERLLWRIMRVLPQHLEEPEFQPLQRYMADDFEQRKCLQLSERLADLFDQYQVYRADWLSAWAAGDNAPADKDNLWQPALWRYLLADVGDAQWNNRAHVHAQFLKQCQISTAQQRPSKVPQRVVVFGISSLPQQTLEVLQALSRFSQVVLCVHNPCQYYWADIIDGRDIYQQQVKSRHQRRPMTQTNEALHAASHPLLASWGKQGRDYIRLLDLFDQTDALQGEFPNLKLDLFEQRLPAQPTILDALRDDVLHLNSAAEARQKWADTQLDDMALQFHSAHSAQREVEVLHDQLLAQFAADKNLKPRDVMVMVPNIDDYAPHIDAVFGRIDRDAPRYIPYSIADQAARHQQPLLIALEYILTISQQRATATEIIELLQVPAIQQRFGILPDQLPQLQHWLDAAGVRWALHQQHRERLGLPASEQNTWLFGLQRMLLGYAIGAPEQAESTWQGIEPFADVGGLEANSVGALQQLLGVITEHFAQAQQARPPQQWASYLNALIDALFAAESDADVILLSRLQVQLEQWLDAVQSAQVDQNLPLTVVLESWLSGVDQPNLNQRFLAGSVNFATLMPMRAIPFKCVCILGMNDGEYPRTQKPFDFDLMAGDYRPGDRSRREDDRYLFLEAILSAQQWLYISWQGRSIQDNSERPPSVLVSQLLEHLQQVYGWGANGARRNGQPWLVEHQLQPFNANYFKAKQPLPLQLFTYANEWHQVHQLRSGADLTKPAELLELAASTTQHRLAPHHLASFLKEAAQLFMRLRFNTYMRERELVSRDEERFALTGLDRWSLLQPVFYQALNQLRKNEPATVVAEQAQQSIARLQRSGEIPLGAAGALMQDELLEHSLAVLERAQQWFSDYPQQVAAIHLQREFAAGLTVEASYSQLQANAQGEWLHLHMTPSIVVNNNKVRRQRPKYAVQAWVDHLLLNTEHKTQSVVLGREGQLLLPCLSKDEADQQLQLLMYWVDRGLRQPLPLELETALVGLQGNHQSWAKVIAAAPDEVNAIHEQAQEFYDEGTYQHPAQVFKAIYTARFYPDYESLTGSEVYNQMVQQLYQPLLQALVNGDAEGSA